MRKLLKCTNRKLGANKFCRLLGIQPANFYHYRTKCGMDTSTVAAAKAWLETFKANKDTCTLQMVDKTQTAAPGAPPAVPPALDFPPDELRYQNYQNLVGAMIEKTFDEIRQTHVPGCNGWQRKLGVLNNYNYNYGQQVQFFADGGTLDVLVSMSGLQIQPAKFKEKGRRMLEAVRLGKHSLD